MRDLFCSQRVIGCQLGKLSTVEPLSAMRLIGLRAPRCAASLLPGCCTSAQKVPSTTRCSEEGEAKAEVEAEGEGKGGKKGQRAVRV